MAIELLNCPHCQKKPKLEISERRKKRREEVKALLKRAVQAKPLSDSNKLQMSIRANKLLVDGKKAEAEPILKELELSEQTTRKGKQQLTNELQELEKDAWEVSCSCNPFCFVTFSIEDETKSDFAKDQVCGMWNYAVQKLDPNDNSQHTPKDCCKKSPVQQNVDGMIIIRCTECKTKWLPLKGI